MCETYRLITDQVGSVRYVVNASNGSVAQALDYDEFGRVISDSNPGFQPFGFAGGLTDRDTKLVHFGAREYDPEAGRWLAEDPILFAGDKSNIYRYVDNDVTNQTDPSGYGGTGTAVGAVLTGIGAMCPMQHENPTKSAEQCKADYNEYVENTCKSEGMRRSNDGSQGKCFDLANAILNRCLLGIKQL